MQQKIKNGVFNIQKRLKRIDKTYYVVYNKKTKEYEVHSTKQKNSYCFSFPYYDMRLISYAMKTSVKNFSQIMEDIKLNNEQIELNSKREKIDYIKVRALDLMEFLSNSSKDANLF